MTTLLAAATLAMMASHADAATFKFDGHGSQNNANGFMTSNDGLDVTITGATYGNKFVLGDSPNFTASTLDLNNWGLVNKRDANDEHVIDGKNGNEVVFFDFGAAVVELTDARFRWTNGYSFSADAKFDLFVDGVFLGRSKYADAATLFAGKTGSIFGIGASQRMAGFKLAGLSAELAPVPLPATGLMLLGALGGLGAMRRKIKTA